MVLQPPGGMQGCGRIYPVSLWKQCSFPPARHVHAWELPFPQLHLNPLPNLATFPGGAGIAGICSLHERGEKAAVGTPTVPGTGCHRGTTLYEPPEKPRQEPNPGKAPGDARTSSPWGSHPGERRSTTMPLPKVPALNPDLGHRDPRRSRRLGVRGGQDGGGRGGWMLRGARAESSRDRSMSWGLFTGTRRRKGGSQNAGRARALFGTVTGGGERLPGVAAVPARWDGQLPGGCRQRSRYRGTHQLEAERPEPFGERRVGTAGRRGCRGRRGRRGGGVGPQPPQQHGGRAPSHLARQVPQVRGQRLPAALHAGGAAAAALSPQPALGPAPAATCPHQRGPPGRAERRGAGPGAGPALAPPPRCRCGAGSGARRVLGAAAPPSRDRPCPARPSPASASP